MIVWKLVSLLHLNFLENFPVEYLSLRVSFKILLYNGQSILVLVTYCISLISSVVYFARDKKNNVSICTNVESNLFIIFVAVSFKCRYNLLHCYADVVNSVAAVVEGLEGQPPHVDPMVEMIVLYSPTDSARMKYLYIYYWHNIMRTIQKIHIPNRSAIFLTQYSFYSTVS